MSWLLGPQKIQALYYAEHEPPSIIDRDLIQFRHLFYTPALDYLAHVTISLGTQLTSYMPDDDAGDFLPIIDAPDVSPHALKPCLVFHPLGSNMETRLETPISEQPQVVSCILAPSIEAARFKRDEKRLLFDKYPMESPGLLPVLLGTRSPNGGTHTTQELIMCNGELILVELFR